MTKDKLWTRDYILLIVMATFQNLQIQLVNPIMARFSRDVGIDIGTAGVIVGIFSLAALVIRPASGTLSDRVNNKLIATVSALGMGLATIGYVISGSSVPLLVLFRFLHGVAFGICGTTLMRMASSITPISRMGEGMGYFGLGQVLSIAVAPAVGLSLADNFGYAVTFIVSTALICGVGVMCLFIRLPKEAPVARKTTGFKISNLVAPEVVGLALVACVLFFANSIEGNFVILYGEGLGLQNLGIYFTVGAVTMFAVRLFTGKLLDKKGLRFVLVPAILCIAASMLLLAWAGSLPAAFIYPVFLLGAAVKAMGHATAQPALQTACVRAVEQNRRGLASGTFYMGCDIGMGLGPIVGGMVAGAAGFPALYLVSGGVALSGLLLLYLFGIGRPDSRKKI